MLIRSEECENDISRESRVYNTKHWIETERHGFTSCLVSKAHNKHVKKKIEKYKRK